MENFKKTQIKKKHTWKNIEKIQKKYKTHRIFL